MRGYSSLTGDPEADTYLLPHLTGELHPNPARRLLEGRPQKLGSEGYPGTQGVQFHSLHGPGQGLVMFTPDADCNPKEFNLGLDQKSGAVAWYVRHYFDETPDES